MTDGHLVTQRRRDPAQVEEEKRRQRERKKSSYKYAMPAKVYEKQEVRWLFERMIPMNNIYLVFVFYLCRWIGVLHKTVEIHRINRAL